MKNIWELKEEIQCLWDEIDLYAAEHEGEIPEDLDLKFEALQMEKDDRVVQLCKLIKNCEFEAAGLSREIKRLQTRKRVAENTIGRVRDWLSWLLDTGETVHKDHFKVSCAKREVLDLHAPDKVSEEYLEPVAPKIVKRRIIEDLRGGKKLEFAILMNKKVVTIR